MRGWGILVVSKPCYRVRRRGREGALCERVEGEEGESCRERERERERERRENADRVLSGDTSSPSYRAVCSGRTGRELLSFPFSFTSLAIEKTANPRRIRQNGGE